MKLNRYFHLPIFFCYFLSMCFLCYVENISSEYIRFEAFTASVTGLFHPDGGRDSLWNGFELHAYMADCPRSTHCFALWSCSYDFLFNIKTKAFNMLICFQFGLLKLCTPGKKCTPKPHHLMLLWFCSVPHLMLPSCYTYVVSVFNF